MIGRRVGQRIGIQIGKGIGVKIGSQIGRGLGVRMGVNIGRQVGYRLGPRVQAKLQEKIARGLRTKLGLMARTTGQRIISDTTSMCYLTALNEFNRPFSLYRQVWIGERAHIELGAMELTALQERAATEGKMMLVGQVDKNGKPFKALTDIMELTDDEAQAIVIAVKYGGDALLDRDIAAGSAFILGKTPLRVENIVARVGT
ncbi:MAG: hypothetical protein GW904_00085 [Candidatus Altiarchaeum hamiconexum]|uniref:Uncharacterized protein n=2 Tax=Candidatus Altarchaeum hamiconexum TaxID=1803513 RepID=A0A8J7YXK6_9ARCH|nr:hypothetical protein [Candidatus Altarchaeum hamiconexum]NCN68146.1 hypothetical protein [Candidatus Altarchaeum hamiconexum]